ncbi:MAG: hypothetical protein HY721_06450 [Planctomycetes bacterium]|nr:hypothetical protein [Planctomycetota bacterium]
MSRTPAWFKLEDVQVTVEVVSVDLADEEAPVRIEGDGRGVRQEGLAGHELDPEALGEPEELGALLRRPRLRRVGSAGDVASGGGGGPGEARDGGEEERARRPTRVRRGPSRSEGRWRRRGHHSFVSTGSTLALS